MIKFAGLFAAVLAAGSIAAVAQSSNSPSGAMKMSQSECESLWNQADASGSGALSQTQAQPFVTNFAQLDANSDSRISRTEFMQGCSNGQVQKSATTGSGTGTTGSGGAVGGSASQPKAK